MEKKLIAALTELSFASKSIADESELRSVMDKYDMLFLGEKFNTINTLELRHTLSAKFSIDITREELNALVPAACSSLNMKFEPMVQVSDLTNPVPYCYQIILW